MAGERIGDRLAGIRFEKEKAGDGLTSKQKISPAGVTFRSMPAKARPRPRVSATHFSCVSSGELDRAQLGGAAGAPGIVIIERIADDLGRVQVFPTT